MGGFGLLGLLLLKKGQFIRIFVEFRNENLKGFALKGGSADDDKVGKRGCLWVELRLREVAELG